MTPAEFKSSLSKPKPPPGLSAALGGLWWAGKDDWEKAHTLIMSGQGTDCAWVHAYLHRLEGDLDNARYWYRQAHRKVADGELKVEWDAIAAVLLETRSDESSQ